MPSLALFARRSFNKPIGAALLALALAGCAQQQTSGFYDTPRDNTLSDAQNKAQGREAARAPSQIQLGFGSNQESKKSQATPAQAAENTAVRARALTEAENLSGNRAMPGQQCVLGHPGYADPGAYWPMACPHCHAGQRRH